MSEVLFGQGYYLRFDPKLWDAMQPYPPLGTLYAASYLRSRGYDVALFDAMLAESEAEWKTALAEHQPRFAVIYEDNFNYLSKMCLLRMRQAAFNMSRMAKEQGCTVIAGGSDASDHAAEYLANGADFVLLGEGEITLGELLDYQAGRSNTPLTAIQGLAFTDDGATISTARRPDIRDVDGLPFPAWDLVDVRRYRKIWKERHGYYSMNMVTTRGCPFHCNWCAKPIWGQRYNARSPENVAAEMKWLKETYQPDHIWFVDDIIGLKPGWLPRFAEAVEANGARISFKCLSRVDLLLREGEVEALKRAGAQIVWVGAESGSQKILDAMDKGTRVEQIYAARRRLWEAGIQAGFFLQFGYPGEGWEDIVKTMRMVRECMPEQIGISVSYPLPGTKFHQAVQAQLGEKQNWQDSSDLAMLYRGPFSTEFYRQLYQVVHKEYRVRKTWKRFRNGQPKRQSNTIPGRQQNPGREAAAALYHAVTLPLARWRLDRLARVPHKGIGALPVIMAPEAAAQPSEQEGR